MLKLANLASDASFSPLISLHLSNISQLFILVLKIGKLDQMKTNVPGHTGCNIIIEEANTLT